MGSNRSQERILNAVMLGGLLVAGSYVARRVTDQAWDLLSDEPPPDPDDPATGLREALLWSLVSGMLVGLARLLLRREFARVRRQPSVADRLWGRLR